VETTSATQTLTVTGSAPVTLGGANPATVAPPPAWCFSYTGGTTQLRLNLNGVSTYSGGHHVKWRGAPAVGRHRHRNESATTAPSAAGPLNFINGKPRGHRRRLPLPTPLMTSPGFLDRPPNFHGKSAHHFSRGASSVNAPPPPEFSDEFRDGGGDTQHGPVYLNGPGLTGGFLQLQGTGPMTVNGVRLRHPRRAPANGQLELVKIRRSRSMAPIPTHRGHHPSAAATNRHCRQRQRLLVLPTASARARLVSEPTPWV